MYKFQNKTIEQIAIELDKLSSRFPDMNVVKLFYWTFDQYQPVNSNKIRLASPHVSNSFLLKVLSKYK